MARVVLSLLVLAAPWTFAEKLAGGRDRRTEQPAYDNSPLAGKTFCRTISASLLEKAGHEGGMAEHCISFTNDKMTDNANALFGHPAEKSSYRLQGESIWVPNLAGPDWVKFPFSFLNGKLKDDLGHELKEKPDAAKKKP